MTASAWIRRLRSRRSLQRTALLFAAFFGAQLAVVLLAPGRYELGGLVVSLRHTHNASRGLLLSLALWYATLDVVQDAVRRGSQRLSASWRGVGWRGRLLLLVAALQGLALAVAWLDALEHGWSLQRSAASSPLRPSFEKDGVVLANPEYFAEQVRRHTPPDARILYHGQHEGLTFAYEVYPRRVFMLPSDTQDLARSWQRQRWLAGAPLDPLDSFWYDDAPPLSDREAFLRARRITHEVYFDEEAPQACRWSRLP